MTAPQVQPVEEDPGKTLGIVGLVLSILGGGLISLIVSIIARNKRKLLVSKTLWQQSE